MCSPCTWRQPTSGLTNGDGLAWADADGQIDLIERIAYRKDAVANMLGRGHRPALQLALGDPDIAMTVKGQAIPAYDPRGIKGMGLGYATSNRGACHLRAYTPAAEIIGNVLGPADLTDRLAWEGKGALTVIFQNVHTMTDCLDVCKFSTFAESLDDFADQYSTMTGVEVTAGDLLKVGRACLQPGTLLQQPGRLSAKAATICPSVSWRCRPTVRAPKAALSELDLMLEEYYAERGWVNGVVPEAKLKELEII